uniref:NADH dehydrogenase subunit 6 n=1 Tax=Bovicola caprae TaxID=1647116 RepID=A0A3P8MXI4_9NEOP|nr:NADH dehydrogenase subunit 6 [Bovicola caprae]
MLLWFSSSSMVMMVGVCFLTSFLPIIMIMNSGSSVMWQVLFLSFVGGLIALVSFMVSTHDDSTGKAMASKGMTDFSPLLFLAAFVTASSFMEPEPHLESFSYLPSGQGFLTPEIHHSAGLLEGGPLVGLVILSISILFLGLFISHEVSRVHILEDSLIC